MKKVLLASSALALVGAFASPAASNEWTVQVGGYMEQYLAYGDSDQADGGDYNGIDNKSDAEIFFQPSITLDNGLKFGANVQLEAAGFLGTSDTIDESYLFVRGSFGELNIGSENSAGYKMTYAAPDVTFVNVNSGSLSSFIPFTGADDVFRGTLGTTFLENNRNNDAQRFTYYTPRFAGFQVGASYARDGNQDTNAQLDGDTGVRDFFDVGANYVNSFGDFNIAVSGRYGIADGNSGDDPEVWSAGLNLGFAGFTVGGSYGEQHGTSNRDGEVWDAGVSYETGPWGFSFTYINGQNEGNSDPAVAPFILNATTGAISGTAQPESGDEELEQYLLGVSYALAKGVALNAFGGYVDFEDANSAGEGVDTSFDGWVVGTGIKISF